jgi:hypothetical protein
MLIKQNMVDLMINDSVASMAHNIKYRTPVSVRGVPVIKQQASAGYAVIEMMSEYLGDGSVTITETGLLEANNNRNAASTNSAFLLELQRQFPEFEITQHKNLRNSEMIEKIYGSLANNMPVIFSYASKIEEIYVRQGDPGAPLPDSDPDPVWTMHYGIIVEIDLPGDKITFNNPHGFTETYTVNNFLQATRFENYENMAFYLRIGFAVEIFSKNTIFIFEPPDCEPGETDGSEEEPEAEPDGVDLELA